MPFFDILNLPAGKAAFEGTVRVDDGGAFVFRVELPNRYPMYGEWRIVQASDPHEFNAEIVSFGYLSKGNVRTPHPDARQPLSLQERQAVEELVAALFATPSVRDKYFPFTSKRGRFLGTVAFARNWIN